MMLKFYYDGGYRWQCVGHAYFKKFMSKPFNMCILPQTLNRKLHLGAYCTKLLCCQEWPGANEPCDSVCQAFERPTCNF